MRKSFILHNDSLDVVAELTTEQKAELFQAIIDYNKGIEPELKGLMKAVFIPFRNQFVRDQEAYENRSETNSNNGKKGGRPRKANGFSENQNKANGFSENQTKAKKAYNDNDNDSDNDSGNDSDKSERIPTVSSFNFRKSLIESGGDKELVDEWMKIRKAKKLQPNQSGLKKFMNEVDKSGMLLNDVLQICCENSWGGFNKDWLRNHKHPSSFSSEGRQPTAEEYASFDPRNDPRYKFKP